MVRVASLLPLITGFDYQHGLAHEGRDVSQSQFTYRPYDDMTLVVSPNSAPIERTRFTPGVGFVEPWLLGAFAGIMLGSDGDGSTTRILRALASASTQAELWFEPDGLWLVEWERGTPLGVRLRTHIPQQ